LHPHRRRFPDLAGKVVAATNCIGAAGDPARCSGSGQDDNGHGTHVAGIVAALRGNGVGIAGIAPDAATAGPVEQSSR